MGWGDDCEWHLGKNSEVDGHDLLQDTIRTAINLAEIWIITS